MPTGTEETRAIEAVVRSLATAAKTLRLYPVTSPIPAQATQAACEAVDAALGVRPTLALVVAREGFTFGGARIDVPGAADLAEALTSHAVAEVDFMPGCTAAQLSAFVASVLREPGEVRAEGGIAAALALGGVSDILVSEVVLTVASSESAEIVDIDSFLQDLAGNEDKLAAWLAAAAAGDPGALADGLAELARAAGGAEAIAAVLGAAFLRQDSGARDAVVGVALGEADAAPIVQRMLQRLQPHDLASSLADGLYAKNMLSMSNVLTRLPLASDLESIIEELRPMLASGGHTERELSFLGHMLEVRSDPDPEDPLAERKPEYRTVAALSRVGADELDRARNELATSKTTVTTRTVSTILALLDQQQDYGLWSQTLVSLASLVPSLLADGDLVTADRVLADVASREARTTRPWPDLAEQVQAALERATSPAAMASLLACVLEDPSAADGARSILRHVGLQAQQRFVVEALARREDDGLVVAESLIGRRLLDLLYALAPDLQWFQVGIVARRLAAEADQRSHAVLTALAQREDHRSRQEVARALADVPTPEAVRILAGLTGDEALEVAIAAVRSLGRNTGSGAAAALADRYERIDSDNRDFETAREIIGALARSQDAGATPTLERIAGRRALIHRGHFSELHDLATRALSARAGTGERG
ncbi:MAG: HEAT repeat domain-containing protein [Coriobacteriia bacterium]|nr:HEAT repeat domain-containing protein [Coriobacteriia bacterium]